MAAYSFMTNKMRFFNPRAVISGCTSVRTIKAVVRHYSTAERLQTHATTVPARIVLVGPPGSGKGSYAKELVPYLGVKHLSPGDLLRAEIASGTPLGNEVKDLVSSGRLVSDEVVAKVVNHALESCGNGFILDGYPRNVEQAKLLSKVIGIDMVLRVKMRPDALRAKLEGRRVCRKCGTSFNLANVKLDHPTGHSYDSEFFHMPAMLPHNSDCTDQTDAHDLEHRADDQSDVIDRRLEVYKTETYPVIEYYREGGCNIVDVDIEGGRSVMLPIILRKVGVGASHK
ncbi:hypothetical protein SARC_02460 [Sphaeroforma arctica JP610]|uniref:C2H2-type domain-containing protein n=1 Tax=Sphaeroforma arctica JP610 TaxID=667725 RepID=A0A0L0G8N4_9EUKA|nr:hypothetical protein SARC_02460 [Sphaeroforma arctica JP610]KNC85370.1 hypothetical protein SARC_02460 [Sphaeroforma arctica JP610]|eukprot:XP_014159272.1 hypothetical protein SARC_02460 [Sphaeroforma arctica JP610]